MIFVEIMTAGLTFLPVKSLNGNGTSTISPRFNMILILLGWIRTFTFQRNAQKTYFFGTKVLNWFPISYGIYVFFRIREIVKCSTLFTFYKSIYDRLLKLKTANPRIMPMVESADGKPIG